MERKGFSHQVFELEGGNFKIQFTPTKLATIRSSPARVVGAVMGNSPYRAKIGLKNTGACADCLSDDKERAYR